MVKILQYGIIIEKMTEKLVKEISTVKKAIKKLREEPIIARVGLDKTGYWKVIGGKIQRLQKV